MRRAVKENQKKDEKNRGANYSLHTTPSFLKYLKVTPTI
jgi:hypothetical protein